MSVKNEFENQVDSEPQETSLAKKLGLGVLGFFICFIVAILARVLIDAVLVGLGSRGGSYGGSWIVAIAAVYFVYDGFSSRYTRMGGRIALGVWIGSIIVGLFIGLAM